MYPCLEGPTRSHFQCEAFADLPSTEVIFSSEPPGVRSVPPLNRQVRGWHHDHEDDILPFFCVPRRLGSLEPQLPGFVLSSFHSLERDHRLLSHGSGNNATWRLPVARVLLFLKTNPHAGHSHSLKT